MRQALERIVTEADAGRYARQVQAVRHARDSRTPAQMAPIYRQLVGAGFGGAVCGARD